MDMIVSEATRAKCPVAAHCCTLEGAMGAVKAGVKTIEHVYGVTDEIFRVMVETGCIMVPTLAIAEKIHKQKFAGLLAQAKRAHELGVRIACGGDTGTFSHGDNGREMELMVECGIPLEDVLEACMVGSWESCGGDLCGRRFGWIEQGTQADIIALDTDPRVDRGALRKVDFVIEGCQSLEAKRSRDWYDLKPSTIHKICPIK
jgi:imidazolonepropionase-like amidohydrolase